LYEKARFKKSIIREGITVHRYLKEITGLILVLLLSGCATLPPRSHEAPLSAQQRQQQLEQLSQFQLNGALLVKTPQESISGSLSWSQQGPYYQANMTNFVGISIFSLSTNTEGATIQADGETHQAASASALLDYLSGWSLPIDDMPLWLKGLASPTGSALQWDNTGRLTQFELVDNQGRQWQVRYTAFFPDALALPKKIELESAADGSRLRLVVRQWQR